MIGMGLRMGLSVRQEQRLELTISQKIAITLGGAVITADGTCPQCLYKLREKEIKAGWNSDPYDARTTCVQCGHRFVALLLVGKIGNRKRKRFQYLCSNQLFTALADVLKTTGRRVLGRTFLFQKQPELLFNMIRHYGTYELGLAAFKRR